MSSEVLIVNAARNSNAMRSLGNKTPKNCHEAVLGWLLLALRYPEPWDLLRLAAPHGTNPPQFTGPWMAKNIYTSATQVYQNTVVANAREGDILYCGNRTYASHSMVIVFRNAQYVKIRGFNNEGTFRGCDPTPRRNEYDGVDRPVNVAAMWHSSKFGAAGEDLFLVGHRHACQRVAESLPFAGSTLEVTENRAFWFRDGSTWRKEEQYG
jgi:hypothetical protein